MSKHSLFEPTILGYFRHSESFGRDWIDSFQWKDGAHFYSAQSGKPQTSECEWLAAHAGCSANRWFWVVACGELIVCKFTRILASKSIDAVWRGVCDHLSITHEANPIAKPQKVSRVCSNGLKLHILYLSTRTYAIQ